MRHVNRLCAHKQHRLSINNALLISAVDQYAVLEIDVRCPRVEPRTSLHKGGGGGGDHYT